LNEYPVFHLNDQYYWYVEIKRQVILILPHPDDEVFCLHVMKLFQDYQFCFIYLTNGAPENDLKSAHLREIESQLAINQIREGAIIFNYGLLSQLTDGKLAKQFSLDDIKRLNEFIGNGLVPCTFISPSLEGGHQDHDAAYIIAQSLSRTWSAEHFSFPLYSSSRFPYPFFRTMKRAEGFTAFPQTLKTRWYFVKTAIKLIKIYRSQKSTWIGLTLPLLVHYAFTSPVYYINQKRRVESIDNFLYESRRLETRKVLELFEKSFSTYN
jgi:LmbE family N-acetylglucosaminyl deacetylase